MCVCTRDTTFLIRSVCLSKSMPHWKHVCIFVPKEKILSLVHSSGWDRQSVCLLKDYGWSFFASFTLREEKSFSLNLLSFKENHMILQPSRCHYRLCIFLLKKSLIVHWMSPMFFLGVHIFFIFRKWACVSVGSYVISSGLVQTTYSERTRKNKSFNLLFEFCTHHDRRSPSK